MDPASKAEYEKLLAKYKSKLNSQLDIPENPSAISSKKEDDASADSETREYKQFKQDILPDSVDWYEKACAASEKLLKIKPNPKKLEKLKTYIRISHLNVTPEGVSSLAMLAPMAVILLGSVISFALFQSLFLVVFFFFAGLGMMPAMEKIPEMMAINWRMKASNQMVLCIFYVVTYMRHTSNMEKAIEFASEHLSPPLSLDLKKVLWNVETGTFDSVKDSLEDYLETWRDYNMEFIEAFHLIQASLYEGSEERRLTLLDKSLDVMLDETYEKMLHYTHDLKSPITMLHMMGVILPILGLVILPLVVSFMEGAKWYHIAVIYNILLPVVVYFMGKKILATRPTGYGDTDILEFNPEFKKLENIIIKVGNQSLVFSPLTASIIFGSVFILIGFMPIILHILNPAFDFPIGPFQLLGYKESSQTGELIGPFGLGAAILSLGIPLGAALIVGLYNKLRSKNLIKIREDAKALETEFASALFQLGNRIGDGIPSEIAFGKVAEVMRGTKSGDFFSHVSSNIRRLGMGLRDAIFHPTAGAIRFFPSSVIDSSMKVLLQSSKKGPQIAAQSLLNISRYVKEIHKVDERLKDLLSDIISSMKSQIKFLTPVISGIVIGITSMITGILTKLGNQMQNISTQAGSQATGMMLLFGDGIPTYHFQIIVGLYVVQIVYILTVLANGIENGTDKLNERHTLGVNMIKSITLYCVVSFAIIVLFNMIATVIMGSIVVTGS